jgi:hypothetical protein
MRGAVLILSLSWLLAVPSRAEEPPRAHWERVAIGGGAELLTLFAVPPGKPDGSGADENPIEEIPLLTVLRDTLGDANPDNDRLSYVWLLADEKRGKLTRWFTPEPGPFDLPAPVIDLSAPGKGMWKNILRSALQSLMLDPSGARLRVPSRSYFSSEAASRTVRLFEAVTVMSKIEDAAENGPLSSDEYDRILARIILAERTFGGLVRDASLARVLDRELGARRQSLGRNWELLRQRAESEHLLFQPIGEEGETPVAALIWVSQTEILSGSDRPFRSKFLGIANPWRDASLREWKGYSETWHFDAEGRRTAPEQAIRSEQMIPLALYSLDHPKSPLLLVDFRSRWKPAAREMARRTVEEVPMTVLGVASFTNFEIRGAQFAWNFIRGRHGAAIHRPSRLRAAAAVRQAIPTAFSTDSALKEEVSRRLGAAVPSSLQRYHALVHAAAAPGGLERQVERDRGRELASRIHPRRTRWLNLATCMTFGLYRYRITPTPDRLDVLDRERRVAHAANLLESALAASVRIDIDGDLLRIRRAAHDLATLPSVDSSARNRVARLLSELVKRTGEGDVRKEFLALLRVLDAPGNRAPAVASGGGAD